MRFIVSKIGLGVYKITEIGKESKMVACFPTGEIGRLMAGDYCDFLNDKYCDKEINEEWPKIDRETRINYHTDQIIKLKKKDFVRWNEHGTGVE